MLYDKGHPSKFTAGDAARLLCYSKGAKEANAFIKGIATFASPETIPGYLLEIYDEVRGFDSRMILMDSWTPASTLLVR